MSYIPKGCDQQGRLDDGQFLPAEACTEFLEDQSEDAGLEPLLIIGFALIALIIIVAII